MQLRIYILMINCILLFPTFGQNNDTLKVIDVYVKNDSILKISVINSNVPYYIFDKNKLNELSSEDIGDALKFIPGTYIKDYGGIGGLKTISYRSLGSTHTGIESDGVILPNTQTASVNLSNFDVFSINQMAMTSGQVQNHFSTASSYIKSNILSIKSDLFVPPTKNIEIKLMGSATTTHAFQNGISYRQKLNDKLSFGIQSLVLYGSGQYDFRIKNIDSLYRATRQSSDLLNFKIKGAINYQLKRLKIHINSSYTNNYQNLPGAVILYNPFNDQNLASSNLNSALKLEYKSDKIAVGFNSFYQKNETIYTDNQFLNPEGFLKNKYINQAIGSGFILSKFLKTETQKIFFGSDFLFANLNGDQFDISPQRFQQNSVVGFSKWITKLKVQGNVSHQFIHDMTNTAMSKTISHFSPFISLGYLPFKSINFRVRAYYKNTYRLPSFNDLYYNTIGNNNLKPENATNVNLGFTFGKKINQSTFETTLDIYRTTIEDKIIAIPTKNLFNWSMQNIGNVLSHGIDFNVLFTHKINNVSLVITSSQSLNKSVDITNKNNSTYRHQIPYTPKYSSSYTCSFGYQKTYISATLLHSGSRYTLNENIASNLMPGFVDLSTSISHTFSFTTQTIYTKLQLGNLLNKNYEVIKSFPMPGRFIKLKLVYKI